MPSPFHNFTIFSMEQTKSIYIIFQKLATELFTIRQIKSSLTFFIVIIKFSFIFDPITKEYIKIILFYMIKVLIIEWIIKLSWYFIIKNSISLKLILIPWSFVGRISIWIIKCSLNYQYNLIPYPCIWLNYQLPS